jgi:hypothetical protein
VIATSYHHALIRDSRQVSAVPLSAFQTMPRAGRCAARPSGAAPPPHRPTGGRARDAPASPPSGARSWSSMPDTTASRSTRASSTGCRARPATPSSSPPAANLGAGLGQDDARRAHQALRLHRIGRQAAEHGMRPHHLRVARVLDHLGQRPDLAAGGEDEGVAPRIVLPEPGTQVRGQVIATSYHHALIRDSRQVSAGRARDAPASPPSGARSGPSRPAAGSCRGWRGRGRRPSPAPRFGDR